MLRVILKKGGSNDLLPPLRFGTCAGPFQPNAFLNTASVPSSAYTSFPPTYFMVTDPSTPLILNTPDFAVFFDQVSFWFAWFGSIPSSLSPARDATLSAPTSLVTAVPFFFTPSVHGGFAERSSLLPAAGFAADARLTGVHPDAIQCLLYRMICVPIRVAQCKDPCKTSDLPRLMKIF